MKKILNRGLAIMLALALSVTMLAAAIYLPATSQPVMLRLMQRCAPPEDTGLPAEEYPAMTEMITAYLKGERDSFQYIYTVNGTDYAAFNQKEQQHMADCLMLFRLCRAILLGGLALSAVLAAGLAALRDRRCLRWLLGGLIALLTLVAVAAVWAMIDFDSLFILFHQLAFTNDLWLLNPYTDMLIRLMPIEFFISYAAIIGVCWLAAMLLMLVGTILLQRYLPKE